MQHVPPYGSACTTTMLHLAENGSFPCPEATIPFSALLLSLRIRDQSKSLGPSISPLDTPLCFSRAASLSFLTVVEVERARSVLGQAHQRSAERQAGPPAAKPRARARPPGRPVRDEVVSNQTKRVRVPSLQQRAKSTRALELKPPRSPMYVMQFDGGSRGNPGPSGAGAVIFRCAV